MQTITLTILANFTVMLFNLYVAFSPKFRPIGWTAFNVLITFAVLNFAMVVINTFRMLTV